MSPGKAGVRDVPPSNPFFYPLSHVPSAPSEPCGPFSWQVVAQGLAGPTPGRRLVSTGEYVHGNNGRDEWSVVSISPHPSDRK